jgi:hypothetical protein
MSPHRASLEALLARTQADLEAHWDTCDECRVEGLCHQASDLLDDQFAVLDELDLLDPAHPHGP